MEKDSQNLMFFLLAIGLMILISRKGLLGGTTSNREEWDIIRDEAGRLKQIVVRRKVRNE